MMASSSSSSVALIWLYHVFLSFRGADVREGFFSHVLKEFKSKGINVFIDNEIRRGQSVGPVLVKAIRHSRVAVVLLSRNYASSSWCLDELVEIMKCREELGQTVMPIFYEVNPADVRYQIGDFGKAFDETCVGKTEEVKQEWRQALKDVAGIAGYHSSNCVSEADMICKVASDVMAVLGFTPSKDFDDFVGIGTHITEINSKLILQSEDVKVIGIWGPPGIGKTSTARVLYNQLSPDFQFNTFLEDIRGSYEKPCGNDYQLKLRFQKNLLSQIFNTGDIKVRHLGGAPEMLRDQKVLVVLDEVDDLWQLEEMSKQRGWFGPGSVIIITTEDRKLLKALGLGINHIYKMKYPTEDESMQIFCHYAFGQKSPNDGFEWLAWEVSRLAGDLPLGLRVMGSYLRGMSKGEWIKALPWLRSTLDREIESTLRFSYDALGDNEKTLFLHIACFFADFEVDYFKKYFTNSSLDVNHGLEVLAQKSLISTEDEIIKMHSVLQQVGREIAKKQSMKNPGKPHFLTEAKEISKVLDEDTATRNVQGIMLSMSDTIEISKSAFQGMNHLEFLYFDTHILCAPEGLDCLPKNLILLHWEDCPLRVWPSNFSGKFLVELTMRFNQFEMLWEGVKPLPCLKILDLSSSRNLKKVPDLSNARNLEELYLDDCQSLSELTNSISNATKLYRLDISRCPNIEDFPVVSNSIIELNLCDTGIKEVPTRIEKLIRLRKLIMHGCKKLNTISPNISKLENLEFLGLSKYSYPSLSFHFVDEYKDDGEIYKCDDLFEAIIEWGPDFKRSWRLRSDLEVDYILPIWLPEKALTSPISLRLRSSTGIKTIPGCIRLLSRLIKLDVKECRELVALPPLPDSLLSLDAQGCKSLKRIDSSSFQNPKICLNFSDCSNLKQKVRNLIHTSACKYAVLPGKEVPAHFTHRASSGSLTINLTTRPLPSSFRFKAFILLSKVYDQPGNNNDDDDEEGESSWKGISCSVSGKHNGCKVGGGSNQLHMPALSGFEEHMYIFEDSFSLDQDCSEAEETTFSELTFVFRVHDKTWKVESCGVRLLEFPHCILDGKETEDQECMGINIDSTNESTCGEDDDEDDEDDDDNDDDDDDDDDEEEDDEDDDDNDDDDDDDDDEEEEDDESGAEDDYDDDNSGDEEDYDDDIGDCGEEDEVQGGYDEDEGHFEDDEGGDGDDNKVAENDDVMPHSSGSLWNPSSPHSIVEDSDSDANGSSQFSHMGTSNVDENAQSEFSSRISVSRPEMSSIREPSISSDRKFVEHADKANKMAPLKNDSRFVPGYNNIPGSSGHNLIDPRVGSHGFYSKSSQQRHTGHIHGGFSSSGVYDPKMLPNQPPLCNTLMQSGFSRPFYGIPMLPIPQSLSPHSIPQQLPLMQLQRPSIQYISQPSEQGISLRNQYQYPLHPMQMMQQTQIQPYYHVQQQPQAVIGQQGAGTSQRQESGMLLHDYLQSPEPLQALLLSNSEKMRELLEQNQKLMQMLQEKQGQL